jgi:hypothetical protein
MQSAAKKGCIVIGRNFGKPVTLKFNLLNKGKGFRSYCHDIYTVPVGFRCFQPEKGSVDLCANILGGADL